MIMNNHITKTDFNGDPNLGLYGFATDRYCILGTRLKGKNVLNVPIVKAKIMGIDFVGMLSSGNSHGIVVPETIEDYELNDLKKNLSKLGVKILVIKTRFTALGNLIMMNDNGIILSPLLKESKKEIEEFFGLKCEISTIADLDVVGSLGIATNKGCLLNPQTRRKEMKIIEKTLGVEADIGTVSFGSPFPKAGLVANSFGYLVSSLTSGPELGRIEEALGFLKD